MFRRILALVFALLMLCALLCGCGEKKELTCDNCSKKVFVDADSNMEEDWAIYCEECNEELFGDDPILGAE